MVKVCGLSFPMDRSYYIKESAHLWVKKEEGGTVRIGMDAFGAKNAGLLTFLIINKKKVQGHEAMGSFESAKFVSRLYAPVPGEIVAVNEEVVNNPLQVNDDPYNSWIVELKPDNTKDIDSSEFIISGEADVDTWIKKEVEEDDDE
jgi:glycine cleavage system H protein